MDTAASNASLTIGEPLTVLYTNHRGETAVRRIYPMQAFWGKSPYHPEPQWLINVFDLDKEAHRIFSLTDMVQAPPVPNTPEEIQYYRGIVHKHRDWLRALSNLTV